MKPYYEIDENTSRIITELLNKCTELDLGNISFSYYQDQIDFYLLENKNGWELVVKQGRTKTDVYKITAGAITYQYSESD